jgi:molybdopterin-synthase adenylyltransferase
MARANASRFESVQFACRLAEQLRWSAATFRALRAELLADSPLESCGVAFAAHDPNSGTWVVDEAEAAPAAAYECRDETSATLRPAFVVDLVNRARVRERSAVIAHTHPFDPGYPSFSKVDDAGEVMLADYLRRRAPQGEHLALVFGERGCRARRIGTRQEVPAWEVGEHLRLLSPPGAGSPVPRFDRQVRAFGAEGQLAISSLRVGVVGLGGTGSVVVQQLARLGVQEYVLIDPDAVEATNLNRRRRRCRGHRPWPRWMSRNARSGPALRRPR